MQATGNLKFFRASTENQDIGDLLGKNLVKIARAKPEGYKFDFLTQRDDLKPSCREEVLFAVGTTIEDLLGYAACVERRPYRSVGQASSLFNLDSQKGMVDFSGKRVKKEDIRNYNGYSDYSGSGKCLYIMLIETFLRGAGNGTRLLEFIKQDGNEMIEIICCNDEAMQFWQRNAFKHTSIYDGGSGKEVMVWNNPNYTR